MIFFIKTFLNIIPVAICSRYYLRYKEIIDFDSQHFTSYTKTGFYKNNYVRFLFHIIHAKTFRSMFFHRINMTPTYCKYFFKGYNCLIIQKKTTIAKGGIKFFHPFSTIINAKYIGQNCTIRNNTTIGVKKSNEVPTIKNNVDIGANVVIIGDIIIGSNVIIGAGAVITKDVPDNSIVYGNPCQIINKN